MGIVKEGIVLNSNNTLSFGNYEIAQKLKITDFMVQDDNYKIRTHKDVTRLSKNSKLLLETVPGATVHNLLVTESETSFEAEGLGDTLLTLELEEETNYSLFVNDVNLGKIKSNISGKINFSTTLSNVPQNVKIVKQ